MAIHTPRQHYECRTCRAPWSDGRWTWGCTECGGGSMTVPCALCLGTCGAVMQRATMDSNDSGKAQWSGKCAQPVTPQVLASRYRSMMELVRLTGSRTLELRVELCDWSSDEAWSKEPRGPHQLQVLLDAAAERNLVTTARAMAHLVMDLPFELPELPKLNTSRYWMSAGTVVILQPTDQLSDLVRIFDVKRVISAARFWLSDPTANELPCAGGQELITGHRYLALVIPTNMVPGMLIEDAVDATGREPELIDLHRRILARGEKP